MPSVSVVTERQTPLRFDMVGAATVRPSRDTCNALGVGTIANVEVWWCSPSTTWSVVTASDAKEALYSADGIMRVVNYDEVGSISSNQSVCWVNLAMKVKIGGGK